MEVSHKSLNKIFNKDGFHSQMKKRKCLQSPKLKYLPGKKPMGEFRGALNPGKLVFVQDPLNLSALTSQNSSLSPKNQSPQSNEFNTLSPPVINSKDPLHLNDVVVEKHQKKRKKRKRRNTTSCCEDDSKVSIEVTPCNEKKAKPSISPVNVPTNNIETDKIEKHSNHKNISEKKKFLENRLFKEKNKKFRYGNFDNYFSLNHNELSQLLNDRTRLFERHWFQEKRCLHIGCNSGFLTAWLAKHFEPSNIVGLDIDAKLIKSSQKAIDFFLERNRLRKFPKSFSQLYGTISKHIKRENDEVFPNNISFHQENYLSPSTGKITSLYDVILCLNICKWIQLNFGDEGIKVMFKKIFSQLKPGGYMLLEFHHIASYRKHMNYSKEMKRNFENMQVMPTDFVRLLLSSEIGFSQSTCLGYNRWRSGGNRPLYLLQKSAQVE